MSDNKTYEARVREVAEEMAAATPNELSNARSHPDDFIPSARIAVKHMAEEVLMALNPKWTPAEKTQYLVLRGLIPSPEQRNEAEEDKPKCEACGSEYGAKWSAKGSACLCPTCNNEL